MLSKGDIVRFCVDAPMPKWMGEVPASCRHMIHARVQTIHGSGTLAQVIFDPFLGDNFRIKQTSVTLTPTSYPKDSLEVVFKGPQEPVVPPSGLFQLDDIVRFKKGAGEDFTWYDKLPDPIKPFIHARVTHLIGNGRIGVRFESTRAMNHLIMDEDVLKDSLSYSICRFEKVPDLKSDSRSNHYENPPPLEYIGVNGEPIQKQEKPVNNIMYKTKAVLDKARADLKLNTDAVKEVHFIKEHLKQKAKEFGLMDDLGCEIRSVTVKVPNPTDHRDRLGKIVRCLEACATKEITSSDEVQWVMTDKDAGLRGDARTFITVDITED